MDHRSLQRAVVVVVMILIRFNNEVSVSGGEREWTVTRTLLNQQRRMRIRLYRRGAVADLWFYVSSMVCACIQ